MSNAHRGEVTFEALGKTWTLKLGTYALSMIESKTKGSIFQFFGRGEDAWTLSDLLLVFHAGLFREHKLTEGETGDLIDEIGIERATDVMKEAFKFSFFAGGGEQTPANPTQPRNVNGPGIGKH